MAKDGDISMGTDNWNVAKGYTHLKILQPIHMLDRLEIISQFGTEEIGEDISYDDNSINRRRVEALQRFHATLKQLLGNCLFALKKEDQTIVKSYIDRMKTVSEYIGDTYDTKEGDQINDQVFVINETLFKKIFEILQDIKDGINTQLNNANLILTPLLISRPVNNFFNFFCACFCDTVSGARPNALLVKSGRYAIS